jgi:hypothetical protein
MGRSTGDVLRMRFSMACRTWLGPKYDLMKIPGPDGDHWLLGKKILGAKKAHYLDGPRNAISHAYMT